MMAPKANLPRQLQVDVLVDACTNKKVSFILNEHMTK